MKYVCSPFWFILVGSLGASFFLYPFTTGQISANLQLTSHRTQRLMLQHVAIASWVNLQAGIVSRHHPLATVDVEAEPMLKGRPIRAVAAARSPRHHRLAVGEHR